jgi:PPE-repeat protein
MPTLKCKISHTRPNVGPGNIGPGNIGPGNIGPGNIGPGNIGPGNEAKGCLCLNRASTVPRIVKGLVGLALIVCECN